MAPKDYLHLYLGCIVEIETKRHTKYGVEKDTRKGTFVGFADYHRLEIRIAFRAGPEGRISIFFIKPILRPLSDLKEEEAIEIVTAIWKEIYGYETQTSDEQLMQESDNSIGFKCKDEEGDNIGLTIDTTRGIEFSVNGNKLIVRQFDITKILLNKHFDLFGLIEAELAIDATKQKEVQA